MHHNMIPWFIPTLILNTLLTFFCWDDGVNSPYIYNKNELTLCNTIEVFLKIKFLGEVSLKLKKSIN